MKQILIILLLTTCFFSCREYYQVRNAGRVGTSVLGGKVTSYTTSYNFDSESLTVDQPMATIADYFEDIGWNISREEENLTHFEYTVAPIDRTATGKQQNGFASIIQNAEEGDIKLTLRLRGNFQFGTKKKCLEIYNDIRQRLYSLDEDDVIDPYQDNE